MIDSQRTAWVWQMTILVLGGKQNESNKSKQSNNEILSIACRSYFFKCGSRK